MIVPKGSQVFKSRHSQMKALHDILLVPYTVQTSLGIFNAYTGFVEQDSNTQRTLHSVLAPRVCSYQLSLPKVSRLLWYQQNLFTNVF